MVLVHLLTKLIFINKLSNSESIFIFCSSFSLVKAMVKAVRCTV